MVHTHDVKSLILKGEPDRQAATSDQLTFLTEKLLRKANHTTRFLREPGG